MRPPESFIAQPIRSLQTMLRVIAQEEPLQSNVIPDGIYGPSTVNAVSTFQRRHALPVTGVTDQITWEAIVAEYEPAYTRIAPAEPLNLVLNPGQIIERGEENPNLYMIQAMLMVLSKAYDSITPPTQTGILDEPTSVSIITFQELNGLPQTGTLDKVTWKHLALHYPLAVNLLIRSYTTA